MPSFRYVIADIEKSLKQNFKDAEITDEHIKYWISVIANRLRKQHFEKHDTGLFTTVFYPVNVLTDILLKNRKYIELPEEIYDLDGEKAVRYITYNFETCCCNGPEFAQVIFQPTTHIKSFRLYFSEYEKPTPENPYFYRQGNRLYFLGLECIDVKDVEVGLFTAIDSTTICDLDADIPLPDELLEVLIYKVISLGNYLLLTPARDRVNEGTDRTAELTRGNRSPKLAVPEEQKGEQTAE